MEEPMDKANALEAFKREVLNELAQRPAKELEEVRARLELEYRNTHKYELLFPDHGPFRRELYPKQMEFFMAGAKYRERMFRAGNQSGKTTAGCYEDTAHLSGQYPPWWIGRRFSHPIKAWICAETAKKVREVLQEKLFGGDIREGYSTGLIPGACVGRPKRKSGTPDAIDFIPIRHITGGWSRLIFKSYEEGWEAFESDVVHVIHLDEEPETHNEKIYAGALMRTITTDGSIYITVTPLHGLSAIQKAFMVGALREQSSDGGNAVRLQELNRAGTLAEDTAARSSPPSTERPRSVWI